jgi:hypothetical protein
MLFDAPKGVRLRATVSCPVPPAGAALIPEGVRSMPPTPVRGRLAAVLLALTIAACGMGGFQRGLFTGKVVDATEDEIVSAFGKPSSVDASDASAPKWIYLKKTFDPDNMNKEDERTIVVMKKDAATGKWKGAEVLYN